MNGAEPPEKSVASVRGTPAFQRPIPIIPDHELLKRIGRGAYGEVWLARNVMGVFRAVKVVYRSDFDHDRPFEREFDGIQKFEPVSRTHESQVDILHVGRNDVAGYFYYVMELADDAAENPKSETRNSKETTQNPNDEFRMTKAAASDFEIREPDLYVPHTLKLELQRRGRLPLEQCLQIGLSLATALEHLHKHGLVHRDVKPSNIIFVNGIPKLADIGLVASMDVTMSFVGTPGYLPPEGPGSPQADIYSLGRVLYEICTGRDRHDFPELPTQWRKFVDEAGLLEFNAVLMKACAIDARSRYQSAEDMRADLALLQAGKSVKRLRAIERRLAIITRIGLVAAGTAALAVAAYFGAVKQTRRAQRAEAEMAQQLYAGDMSRAMQFWEKGNVKRTLELLEPHRPDPKSGPGEDLRSFEWFYLWRLCHKDAAKFTWRVAPDGAVPYCFFSPDARFLAVSVNGALNLWDVGSRRLLRTFANYYGDQPDFSPDGQIIALGTRSGSIELWDNREGKLRTTLPAGDKSVSCFALSSNGHFLAEVSLDATDVILWDVGSAKVVATLPGGRGGYVYGLAFSPDGELLAVGHRDNIVSFWDSSTHAKLGDLEVPMGFASALVFSPDGRTLAVAGNNAIVALCDAGSRTLAGPLLGHEGQVNDVAFSPDGRRIATASDDTTVKLWDSNSRQLLSTFKGHLASVGAVAISADGETVYSASDDGLIKEWEAGRKASADVLLGHTDWARSVAFSSDGTTLASAGKDKTLRLWDVATGRWLFTFPEHQRPVYRLAWSPDGRTLASVSGLVTEPGGLGELKLWDTVQRKELISMTDPTNAFFSVAFSPDSKTVATGQGNGAVTLWDVVSRRSIATWMAHSNQIHGLAFSPDGKLLATGSHDNSAKLWSVATRRELSVFPGSPRNKVGFAIWCVAFSPGGHTLAVGNDDGVVSLWNIDTRTLHVLKGTAGRVYSITFPRDGRTLIAGSSDRVITLWSLATGQEMVVLKGHEGFVESVALSPDETVLASAGADKTVRLWRAASRRQSDGSR